jgi:hypothetical protein
VYYSLAHFEEKVHFLSNGFFYHKILKQFLKIEYSEVPACRQAGRNGLLVVRLTSNGAKENIDARL